MLQLPYDANHLVDDVPGRRWQASRGAFAFPMTAGTARLILTRLEGQPQEQVKVDPQVTELLQGMAFPFVRSARTPRNHQLAGFNFAAAREASNMHIEMGGGKTKIAIDLEQNDPKNKNSLIVCPKSVIDVWPFEFKKDAPDFWAEARVAVLDTGDSKRNLKRLYEAYQAAERGGQRLVTIINYESAWRADMAAAIEQIPWSWCILDEVQKIKSASGKASRFFAKIGPKIRRRLGLSGTPITHSFLDAYGIFRFLEPSIFGTNFTMFKAEYAWMDERTGMPGIHPINQNGYANTAAQKRFHEKYHSITYHAGAEILDLPEATDIIRQFDLTPDGRRVYLELKSALIAGIKSGVVTAANAMVLVLRLQQVACGFAPVDGEPGVSDRVDEARLHMLDDILEEIDLSEPVVVFCRFRMDLAWVRAKLHARKPGRVGEVSGSHNDYLKFRTGEVDDLVVQIHAGSLGLDFTRARYSIYYSLTFSVDDYLQSRRRMHRQGQTRNSYHIYLQARGTVDGRICGALARRMDAIDDLVNAVIRGEEF